jgi:carbamate kinase
MEEVPKMPLYACVAQSQGLIGYMIQEVLYNKLHSLGIHIPVVTVITQVVVNRDDKAFSNPTKPIGPYYRNESELPPFWHIVETLSGVRRIVPSPEPLKIIETDAIKALSEKAVVIACGGGGIPVVKDMMHVSDGKKSRPGLYGVDAVIDKDVAGAKLASELGADLFVILTDVDSVYLNWIKPNRRVAVRHLTVEKARQYLKEGHFLKGTMEPKIRASIGFLENGGKKVLITDLDKVAEALKGHGGTVVEG